MKFIVHYENKKYLQKSIFITKRWNYPGAQVIKQSLMTNQSYLMISKQENYLLLVKNWWDIEYSYYYPTQNIESY